MKFTSPIFLLWAFTGLFAVPTVAEPPRQSRQIQYIEVFDQYRIALDTDPQWSWSVSQGKTAPIFTAQTPDNYYPPTTINISFFPKLNLSAQPQILQQTALSSARRAATNFSAQAHPQLADMAPFSFKHSSGYYTTLKSKYQGQILDIGFYTGRFSDGSLFSMTVYTAADKLPHLSHAISRIGNSLQRAGQ